MILTTEERNDALDNIFDKYNSGTLKFHSAAHAVLATTTFGATAFASAAAGQKVANAITKDSSVSAGTIDHAHVIESDTTEGAQLTCGTTGADINLTTLTLNAAEELSITSLTMTLPAS